MPVTSSVHGAIQLRRVAGIFTEPKNTMKTKYDSIVAGKARKMIVEQPANQWSDSGSLVPDQFHDEWASMKSELASLQSTVGDLSAAVGKRDKELITLRADKAELLKGIKQFLAIYPDKVRAHPDVKIACETARTLLAKHRRSTETNFTNDVTGYGFPPTLILQIKP